MTITLTLPMIIFIISLMIGWTGFLLGGIKWLLNRQLIGFEQKVADTETKAAEAVAATSLLKQTVSSDITQFKDAVKSDLHNHKESLTMAVTALRLDFSQKVVCSNHARMEKDNINQFGTINKLNGNIQQLSGKIDGLANLIDLLMSHHINGGK